MNDLYAVRLRCIELVRKPGEQPQDTIRWARELEKYIFERDKRLGRKKPDKPPLEDGPVDTGKDRTDAP